MKLSRRAIVAESIKELYNDGFTAKPKANLKKLVNIIGESRLLDVITNNLFTIRPGKPVLASKLITTIGRDARNEYLYELVVRELPQSAVKVLNRMLNNENKFLACKVQRFMGAGAMTATRNLIDMLMRIDVSKDRHASSGSIRKVLSKTNRQVLIDDSRYVVRMCAGCFEAVIDRYMEKTEEFTKELLTSRNNHMSLNYVGKVNLTEEVSYMYDSPRSIQEIESPLRLTNDTTARRAIEKVDGMPFIFDEEFNKAVMAIIDTPLFDSIIKGKSTDTNSVEARIHNIRSSVKAGIAQWENSGSSNVFFNYVVDFRGRISQLGGLSAVGHKVGKAMLRSGVKYPLGRDGYNNLLIALAGAMGRDKDTFKQRLDWATQNAPRFTDIGGILLHSPEVAFKFLQKEGADEIFSAAAICLELFRIKGRKCALSAYESDIFIGYDATSSAVQLVGLIMGNKVLTEASNCRVGADTEDKIHDAYMLIANCMDTAAPKIRDEKNNWVIDMWLGFDKKIKRAMAKPLLMTRLYGSKFLTHMKNSKEVAVEKGIINQADTTRLREFGHCIAALFNNAFDNEAGFDSLRAYEDFVKSIAKAYTSVDKQTSWHVYDDLEEAQEVKVSYVTFEGEKYYYFTGNKQCKRRVYSLHLGNDYAGELDLTEKVEIDSNKAVSSIAPNYIHSHDALVLHSLVNAMDCPIRLTHDCFAVPAGRLTEMHQHVVDIYCNLFGDNRIPRLELLQKECFEKTGVLVDLPEEYNPLGISTDEIRKAQYLVS